MDDAAIPSCLECGACCKYARVPPFTDEEIRTHPMREEIERLRADAEECATLVCSLWDHGCKHYADRPLECRNFNRGSLECLEFIKVTIDTGN